LEREQIVYWKFKNGKDDGFVDIVSRMKPELSKEIAQEYF
jgi:hypothetical protein